MLLFFFFKEGMGQVIAYREFYSDHFVESKLKFISPRVKWPGREANFSSPSSAKVRKT
jgi:hypothetical protein